jgi:hypothetical protein
MKETKTEEKKMRRPFGTKETSGTFPPEACSNNMVSQEKKKQHGRRPTCKKDVVQIFI